MYTRRVVVHSRRSQWGIHLMWTSRSGEAYLLTHRQRSVEEGDPPRAGPHGVRDHVHPSSRNLSLVLSFPSPTDDRGCSSVFLLFHPGAVRILVYYSNGLFRRAVLYDVTCHVALKLFTRETLRFWPRPLISLRYRTATLNEISLRV